MDTELIINEIKALRAELMVQKPKTWLPVKEAASYIGIGKSKMYDLLVNRELPYSCIGGKMTIKIEAIERYMKFNEIPARKP